MIEIKGDEITTTELYFENMIPQGPYKESKNNGSVEEGTYVNGKKHGPYKQVFSDGSIEEGTYADG